MPLALKMERPQAKECNRPLEGGKGEEMDSPEASRRKQPC